MGKKKTVKSKEYSVGIGFLKSVKNTAWTIGSAGLVYLLNNVTEWVPTEYVPIMMTIAAMLGYGVKNRIGFKK